MAEIYGCVPSFHDAHVLEFSFAGRDLEGKFYIYDLPEGGQTSEDEIHVIAELLWSNVREATVYITDNWLSTAEFVETEDGVRSELVDMESGETGLILADSVSLRHLHRFEPTGKRSFRTVRVSFV